MARQFNAGQFQNLGLLSLKNNNMENMYLVFDYEQMFIVPAKITI